MNVEANYDAAGHLRKLVAILVPVSGNIGWQVSMVVTVVVGVVRRVELSAVKHSYGVQMHPMIVVHVGKTCRPVEGAKHQQWDN